MKDILEDLDNVRGVFYLIKIRKNKRSSGKRFIYLYVVNFLLGNLYWGTDIKKAMKMTTNSHNYKLIMSIIRGRNIQCSVLKVPKQPVRKEKWWGKFKVWFSRKVQYFAGYISIERPMKD